MTCSQIGLVPSGWMVTCGAGGGTGGITAAGNGGVIGSCGWLSFLAAKGGSRAAAVGNIGTATGGTSTGFVSTQGAGPSAVIAVSEAAPLPNHCAERIA